MKKTILSVVAVACFVASGSNLVLIGDSTMADYTNRGYRPRYGWGECFAPKCNKKTTIVNLAIPGTSSRNWIEGKDWTKALKKIGSGDIVFIQFGHNDVSHWGNDRVYTKPDDFKANLARMSLDVKAKGATPVILSTTLSRKNVTSGKGAVNDYNALASGVAAAESVKFVDLAALFRERAGKLDEKELSALYMPDNIHLTKNGAEFTAGLVAELLSGSELGKTLIAD